MWGLLQRSVPWVRLVAWVGILGLGIGTSLFLFPREKTKNSQRIPTPLIPSKSRAKSIRFYGVDQSGHPYVLTASQGEETTKGVIFLEGPTVILHLEPSVHLTLTAFKGEYSQKTNLISLTGDVTMIHSEGKRVVTSQVWIDMGRSIAYGEALVQGEGPEGRFSAHGFQWLHNQKKFILLGRPEIFLIPSFPESFSSFDQSSP